ncbi:Unknown protein, partial [Striga hermonthica]
STSSRDDDDELSWATRATRTTQHHSDRRTHGHRHHREEHVRARPKITMPTFEGTYPDAWLSRAMQFFEINEVPTSERVQIAAYYLDGEANTWWQWVSHVYKNKGEQIKWRDFEKELITRFGSSDYFDYDEVLTRIRQTGSLRDYQKEFERIASRVRDWPESALVGAFVGGLKAELAAEVQLDRPKSTRSAMEAARLHEDHLAAVRKARPSEGRTDVRRASVAVDDTPPRVEVKPAFGEGMRTTSSVRRLTDGEMQRRRENGLCYTCNEKFTPGHKCKGKEVFLLEIGEEYEEEKPQEESLLHVFKCKKRGPKMIRFTAEIKDLLLEVLVDSGSSLNFIDEGIARRLKLEPTKVKKFGVKVSNGHELQGNQLFKKVPIMAQDQELEIDLYTLPLKTTDIVLGVRWLETLGPITTDYRRGKMEFGGPGKCIKLRTEDQGDSPIEEDDSAVDVLNFLILE